MSEAGLPAGYTVAIVDIGGRQASVVLHGSAGKVVTGTEASAVEQATQSGREARIVLLVGTGDVPGSNRYVIRTVRQQVGVGDPFELDIDAARLSPKLLEAHPSVVGIVGESSWISRVPGRNMPVWSAAAFGEPDLGTRGGRLAVALV